MFQFIPLHALHVAAATSQHATTATKPGRVLKTMTVYSPSALRPLTWLSVEA